MKREIDIAAADLPVATPDYPETRLYSDASEAVDALNALYEQGASFLRDNFRAVMAGRPIDARYRAF